MKFFTLFLLFGLLSLNGFSQTSYTWTGSSNTDWATSSNWSPSGVPTTSDAVSIASSTNQPVLDGNRTVASLTLSSSSILDLNTNTLTVSGTGSFTSCTVSNGELITGSFNASSSTFYADVSASGSSIITTSSTYQGIVSLNYTGSSNVNSGGNTFVGVCHITQSGSGLFVFGHTNPDVFEDSLFAVSNGGNTLVFGISSIGNRFEGYTLFQRGASATSSGIQVGNVASTTSLLNHVRLSSNSSAVGTFSTSVIDFRDCLFDSTASVGIDSSGFALGQVKFLNSTVAIPTHLSLSGNSSFLLDNETVFEDSLSLSASNLLIHQCELQGFTEFTKTGSGVDQSLGPITATGSVHFKNTGSGLFYIEGDYGDSYQDVTLENTSTGNLAFCRRGTGNTIAGDLETIITNGTLSIGIQTANRASITGDISINSTGGLLFFGGLNQQSGSSISYTNLGGGITFKNFNQLSSSSVHLVSTGSSNRITLGTGSSFSGKFKAEFPSIMIQGGTYADSLTLIKTGNITDQGSGNLTCYGPVSFKSTHSSGTWQINYAGAACVYHDDVIYDRSGSGAFEFGYGGPHQFKKDFFITGTHAFGTTNNYFTFNGTGNQTISRGHSLSTTFIRLAVDKPSGDLMIDLPLTLALNLNLQKGIIKPTAGNNFAASLNTTITGGSDSAYVEDAMLRYGASAFTYPVGGGGVYAPVTLDAVASNCTFRVEYIPEDPDSLYSRTAKDTSIGFINRCGYWNIDRTFGTQNTTPSLGWDNNPCYSTSPVDASVVQWDGSTWKDKGNAAYSGTSTAGNVKSTAAITSYPAIINLGGVCSLQAELSANRDTLIEGYLATFTASPANQYNYKFYVNGVLKQDSSVSIFKTSNLENGDSLKVIVRNINNCLGEALVIVNVGQTDNLDGDIAWLFDYNLFANDSIIIVTSDSIYCSEKLITTDLSGNSNVINADVVQTPSIVDQYHNYGLTLKDNLNNLVGQPIGINDSNVVLTPGIYYLESADILKNKFILNGSSNSLFIFNIDDDASLDSLVLLESSYLLNNNRVIFNVNGNVTIANISLNYYSLFAQNIIIKENNNLHGSLWASKNIRMVDPIVFYGQGFPSEPDNCDYSDYPCNLVKNSEFSCPLPTTTWGPGWQPNGSFGLNQVTNQVYWQNANASPGSYLQRETISGNTQYYLGLNPGAHGSAVQQLTGFNIQQGELYYIKFRYRNAGNSCNTTIGYCPLDRLFVSVSEGVAYSPFSSLIVANDASFTNDPTYNLLPVAGGTGLPQRTYFTDSQLGNITNLDWVDYVSGPHTAGFDINSISFYARISQGHGDATLWGGNVFIDDVKLESCCLGDLATLVSSKTSDFINDSETTLPTVKQELASIISISSIDPAGFDGTLENIKVTINANNSGTISIVGSLSIDVGELEILNSELLFSKCSSISFLNQSINLKKLIINSSFLHSCDSKLWSGILINGSNSESLYIINNSRIEDAIAAVQARNNPLLIIDNNKFNRNIKHIQIRNSKDQINSVITNNKFLCNDPSNAVLGANPAFAFSETDCQDEYFLPYITNIGIDLQLVNNLTIDNNNFENSYCGIRCLASSIIAEDNTFHLIRNFVNPTEIDPANNTPIFTAIDDYAGCGIFQNNSFLTSKLSTAGGYLYIDNSTFTNLRYGVRILNSNLSRISKNSTSRTDIKIQNCEFNNAAYSLNGDVLNTAITINGLRAAGYGPTAQVFAQNMLIEHNDIDGFSYGIDIKDSQSDLDIQFNNISTIIQTNNWLLRTAISLKEFYAYNYILITYPWFPWYPLPEITAYEPYFINNNIIGDSDVRDIVLGRGINSESSSYGNILANTVNMYAINTSQSAFGIVSLSSASVYIVDNIIRRNNALVPSNYQYANNGILIENSKSNIVCENEIYNFASGLRIVNSSNNLQVKCNLFSGYQYQGVSLKNALFGNQVFDTGAPFDNRWVGTSGKRIRGGLNGSIPHQWHYGSSTAYLNQLELDANAPSSSNVYVTPFSNPNYLFQTVNVPSSTGSHCDEEGMGCTDSAIPTFFGAKRLGQRDSLFGSIINDFNPELFSDTSSAGEYSMIKYAFETFYIDPSWLNIGDPSDTLYQNYFLACLDLPLAKQTIQNSKVLLNTPDSLMIDSLESLYNDNDTLISEALNQWTSNNINQIISENSRMSLIHKADSVAKQALNIYYNTWQKGKYTLTASDSATLNSIAFDDPSISGDGVYLARMLLDTIVVEVEQQTRLSEVEKQENGTNDSFNPVVFPNPTNGTFTIDLNFEPEKEVQVSLMDLTGRIVFNAIQVSQIKSYSFDYLASGVYLYRIEYNKSILSQDKLVIQKP